MNPIQELRDEIEAYFDPALRLQDSDKSSPSPDGRFLAQFTGYKIPDPTRNWNVALVTVTEIQTGRLIAQFKRGDDHFLHCWATTPRGEYLFVSEGLEGQGFVDLSNGEYSSYIDPEDRFIWAKFRLSPNGDFLAIEGCIWACPYEVRIYDLRGSMTLPLLLLNSMDAPHEIGEWADDSTLTKVDSSGVVSTLWALGQV